MNQFLRIYALSAKNENKISFESLKMLQFEFCSHQIKESIFKISFN